jgi:hypothetical protein
MLIAWTSLVSSTNMLFFTDATVATNKGNTRTADASGCGQLHLHYANRENDLEGAADLSAIYDGPYFSTKFDDCLNGCYPQKSVNRSR